MTIRPFRKSGLLIVTVPAILGTCTDRSNASLELREPVAVVAPAPAGSAQPFVDAAGDAFLVSWTEPAGDGHALRFATLDDAGAWGEPQTVAAGQDWFVNWADFPSVVALSDSHLAAHWLQRSGPGTYSYDVMITQSADGGRTWSEPVRPHTDGTESEHGFVSLFPYEGALGAVWLDGRRFAGVDGEEPTNQMTVRFTRLDAGAPGPELLIDERACDCCQTGAALTSAGPIVAYRDRTEEEIRDISVVRLIDGGWTEPARLHADEWYITGCPVNGPQVAAEGDDVAIAWFTQAQDTPRVQVAFSADAGATFGDPVRIDEGAPLGRVDVLLLDDGRALVVWLERAGEEAEVRGRLVRADGSAGSSRVLGETGSSRSSGFPRLARRGSQVLLVWNATGAEAGINAALLDAGA